MKGTTTFLGRLAIVLLGAGALVFLLGEPHLEGRNAHATVFEVYFKDPFLAYVYVGSVPFFLGLWRAFVLLGRARDHGAYSQVTVDGLRDIRRCALALIGFVGLGILFIVRYGDGDDRPVGFVMGGLIMAAAGVVAMAAKALGRRVRAALPGLEGGRS